MCFGAGAQSTRVRARASARAPRRRPAVRLPPTAPPTPRAVSGRIERPCTIRWAETSTVGASARHSPLASTLTATLSPRAVHARRQAVELVQARLRGEVVGVASWHESRAAGQLEHGLATRALERHERLLRLHRVAGDDDAGSTGLHANDARRCRAARTRSSKTARRAFSSRSCSSSTVCSDEPGSEPWRGWRVRSTTVTRARGAP
ncbi:MAG: hypothetical protein QOI48_1624 [Solirubrobacteraceae bacterium]|nr:hypothetical protein [Solirubrobacteraceae bacterium]